MYPAVGEKRRIDDINIEDEEAIGTLCRLSGRPSSPKSAMEQEKRMRREIANSNERRRMQSINAGFTSLKTLLPHHEGEKLSKAAILQQTAEYIYQLEQEKTRLLSQNSQLKRLLNQQHASDSEGSPTGEESPSEDRNVYNGTPPPSSGTANTLVPVDKRVTEEEFDGEQQLDSEIFIHRDRKRKLKLNADHIRGLESEVYAETVKSPMHVSEFQHKEKKVKIEIKHEEYQQSFTPMTELNPAAPIDHEAYGEIHVPKPGNVTALSRVPSLHIGMPSNPSIPLRTNGNQTSILNHPTAIVTVMPPPEEPPTKSSLSSMEEMDINNIPPTIVNERIEDISQYSNHTLYIVKASASPCQKSLDTICEAIRHLEGDHMFPPNEHHQSDLRMEEEVITEETYTVEEGQHEVAYLDKADGGESLNHLTLHMIEPQEAPLELTTSNRDAPLRQYSFTHQSPAPTLVRHSSRPGVIVVKHS